jgi:hypothetical protein
MTDTRSVNDDLDAIPPARRRRMALALAPVGLVLLLAGILTVSLDGVGWKLAGLLVAVLAVVLLGVAWGLRRSAALSESLAEATAAEQQLDEVLIAAARSSGEACGGAGAERSRAGELSHESERFHESKRSHNLAGLREPADVQQSEPSQGSTCASAGLVCGSAGAPGGCGASCLTRSR